MSILTLVSKKKGERENFQSKRKQKRREGKFPIKGKKERKGNCQSKSGRKQKEKKENSQSKNGRKKKEIKADSIKYRKKHLTNSRTEMKMLPDLQGTDVGVCTMLHDGM